MVKIQQFNQSLLYNAESPFKIPKILNISFGVFTSLYNSSILIKNLELSGDGAVYFIMEPYEKTLEDSDFPGEYYNETIKNYQKPTAAQIKGCLNYLNQTASVCVRAFYYNDVSYDIEIRLVESYTVYKVYYMVANENPMFPIFDNSQVYEAEVLSYSIFGEKVFGWKIWETAILIGIVVSFIF